MDVKMEVAPQVDGTYALGKVTHLSQRVLGQSDVWEAVEVGTGQSCIGPWEDVVGWMHFAMTEAKQHAPERDPDTTSK